jgi:Tol biopolymer transport system component
MWLLKHRAFSSVNEISVNKNFERQKQLKTLGLKGEKAPAAGVWNIYVKELTSESSAYRVTEDSDWVSVHNTMSWSPNDTRIFFVTLTPEGYSGLRYVDATETTDRVSHPYLTEYLGWMNGVDFSRAAVHYAAYIHNGELYVVQVDDFGDVTPGARARQITDLIDLEGILSWPKWSPDGSRVTCGHFLTPHSAAIWVLDIAGLALGDMVDAETHPNLTIITDTANFAATPQFSYDGRYIYYCEDVNNVFNPGRFGWNRRNSTETMLGSSDFDLFVARADGSAPPERLTIAPLSQGVLSASPDGTLLAYNTDNNTDGDGVRDGDIYIQSLVSSQNVATTGGEVSDGSGTRVVVPAGALEPETTITIETPLPGSTPPLDTLPVGASLALAREFAPDGLLFATPVKIEIHYTDEEVAGLDEANLQIYYCNDAAATWEALPTETSCTNPASNVICAWVEHFSTFAVLDVPTLVASVEIQPNSLNVKSKGNYLTAYIELPTGFSPASIVVSSVRLNGSVATLASPTSVGDYNANKVADLMVKFDRAAVQSILPLGWAPVTVTGLLANGVPFEDNLSIYVFDKGMSHQNESRTDSIVQ